MICLMIETKDKRKFFTYEKYFPQLIDFAKTFEAEITKVSLKEPITDLAKKWPVLHLAELAMAICDTNYKNPPEYEVIQTKLSPARHSRTQILRTADKIQKYIMQKFKSKEIVSLTDLKEKFREYNLTTACFCNHIRKVISQIDNKVEKLSAGKYKIKTNF